MEPSATETACPLSALATIAGDLFVSLPDSPQGTKPFLDRADAGSPASLLRAMRRRLNLTQREFGILLSPSNPISPSVICQLESALQTVPAHLVSRAVAATTAAQRLGEFLCKRPGAKAADAAAALKVLGPGCVDEMQPYLEASPELPADEANLVREFLAIVTKRRHSTGGSRPGARGPYRKLSKLSQQKSATADGSAGSAAASDSAGEGAVAACAPSPASATTTASASASTDGSSPRLHAGGNLAGGRYSPRGGQGEAECSSGRSTPCSTPGSTPGSSRGSSRPRSPTSCTGYESHSARSESDYASSPALTPGGTVGGMAQLVPGVARQSSEVSLDVLMALRRLQEENEALLQENKRLKAMATGPPAPPAEASVPPPVAPSAVAMEISRVDVGMSC